MNESTYLIKRPDTGRLAGYAAGLMLLSSPVFAQTNPDENEVYDLPAFEVSTQMTAGYMAIGSVVASGFSIETVKNPINISALTAEFVKDMRFDDLADAVTYMSGVQKSPARDGSFHGTDINVRGFRTFWFNRNGIRRYIVNGTDNLDRLEVVKGPAAVFFGQAAPGGVVNYVTRRPSFTPENRVEATYGSYDYKRFEVSSQGPLISDKVAYRINASYLDKEDWRDWEYQKRSYIFGGLLVKPFKNLKFFAEYERIKDRNNDALALPQGGTPEWVQGYLGLRDPSDPVLSYYAANPGMLKHPSASLKDPAGNPLPYPSDLTVDELRGFSVNPDGSTTLLNNPSRRVATSSGSRTVAFPNLRQRWDSSTNDIPVWAADTALALGVPVESIDTRRTLVPGATPYGAKWNNLGPGGLVKHDLENITLEGIWEPTDWLTIRGSRVYDNPYRYSFLSNAQVFDMEPDGPKFAGQKLTPGGLFNETVLSSLQAVMRFETGFADHSLLLGWDRFEDDFFGGGIVDDRSTSEVDGFWNYFTQPYPVQAYNDTSVSLGNRIENNTRTSQTANYIVRLWNSRVVGMVGMRREEFLGIQNPDSDKPSIWADETETTPSYGMVVEVIPGFNLFASKSESFDAYAGAKSAQLNTNLVPGTPDYEKYDTLLGDDDIPNPASGKGWDAGIKTNWRNNTLAGSVAYFSVEETNRNSTLSDQLTLTDPRNAEYLAANPDADPSSFPIRRYRIFSQKVEGIDLDLSIVPNKNWAIIIAYAHILKAETGEATPRTPVATPENSFSIWNKFDFTEGRLAGLSLGAGFNYKSEYYLRTEAPDRNYVEDGYVVWDFLLQYKMSLKKGTLTTSINLKNAFNEFYYSGGAGSPGEARKLFFTAAYTF